MRSHDHLFIGGEWTPAGGDEYFDIVSPSSQEVVGRVPRATGADVDRAVLAARTAFDSGPWPRTDPADRGKLLAGLADQLVAHKAEFSRILADEVGTPLAKHAGRQVDSAAAFARYYSSLAETYPFQEHRQGPALRYLVRREPVGTVGAIVPWNVPLSIAVAKLAPALLAGCTVVLKPAQETPLDAYLVAEILHGLGLPPGVLNVLPADRDVSEQLVRHPGIDKISFTGSTAAGRRVAALCGEKIKRVTLELGGKSAAVILDDADLSRVIPALVPVTMLNNGQACLNQTRVLAPFARYREVVRAVTEAVATVRTGDPFDPATDLGPLISQRQRDRVEHYIAGGLAQGATLTVGGGRPPGLDGGWYVEPTVFADVDNRMTIAQEEIFGPVVSIIPYEGDDQAVAIANDSPYGLSGTVWSADTERALDLAARVRTGNIGINGFGVDISAPFGGFKSSGIGREYGPEGLDAYVELKAVHLPMRPKVSRLTQRGRPA